MTQAGIEDLRVKRDTIRTLLQVEEEEKIAIQRGLIMLNQRLVQIDDSLSRKYDYTIECDKRIHEIIEAATDSKVSDLYILTTSLSSAPANMFLSQFSSPLCAASRTGLLSFFSLYKSPQTFSSPRLSFDMFQGSEVGLRSGNLCIEEDP